MTALAIAKAAWAFLRGLPWQVWAVAALAVAVWLYGGHRYDAGVADERARWVAAQEKADKDAKERQDKRDNAADKINDTADARAQEAVADTRGDTAKAVEKVNDEMRTVVVPGDCHVTLPDRVREEGRAAVERARAAAH